MNKIAVVAFIAFVWVAVIFLFIAGGSIFSDYPQNISKEQLQSLRLTSYLSYSCLPDSINHYEDSLVLKDSSALLFKYDYDARFLLDNVRTALQNNGFTVVDTGNTKIDNFDFYWLSAENGNIFVHVTALYTGFRTYISVASGKNVEDVLSIRICTDRAGSFAELRSNRSYNPTNANIVRTAPLAGTIYALYYPNNPLCGSPSDEINILTKKSFNELLLKNSTSQRLDFIWACGNIYKPARFEPTNAILYSPRGVAYAMIIVSGGGFDIK